MKPGFDTDMQGDVLAIHRGDRNRDDILRYPKKTDECGSEAFRDGDEDEWRASTRDEEVEQHEQQNTLDMIQKGRSLERDDEEEEVITPCDQRVSISRGEVGTPRRNEEDDRENLHGRRNERDLSSERGDEQITPRKNDSCSPKVDALEDKRDSLEASGEKEVAWCSSESVKKEDGHESLKQYESLERVNRDDEQAVLERDEKVLGSGSQESPNALTREIKELDTQVSNGQAKADELRHLKLGGTEEATGICNRCENRDENKVFGKDGEDNSSMMPRVKDDEPQSLRCETQVADTAVREMEMREVTGEQDSPTRLPDTVKVAGETFQNVYFNGPVLPVTITRT